MSSANLLCSSWQRLLCRLSVSRSIASIQAIEQSFEYRVPCLCPRESCLREEIIQFFHSNPTAIPTLLGAFIAASAGFITVVSLFALQLYKESRAARQQRRRREDTAWRALELAGGYLQATMPTKTEFINRGFSWQHVQTDMGDTYKHLVEIRPTETMQQSSSEQLAGDGEQCRRRGLQKAILLNSSACGSAAARSTIVYSCTRVKGIS